MKNYQKQTSKIIYKPIWCNCGVRIIHSSPFDSDSLYPGAEIACADPALLSPGRPEAQPYNDFNSTHCLSLSGTCFRTVRFIRKNHVPDFYTADERNLHVHKKAYGCVANDLFAKMRTCRSKPSSLVDDQCCKAHNCNAEETLGPTGAEQRAQARVESQVPKHLFALVIHK